MTLLKQPDELIVLLSAMCDGHLTPDQLNRLNRRLLMDRRARLIYLNFMETEASFYRALGNSGASIDPRRLGSADDSAESKDSTDVGQEAALNDAFVVPAIGGSDDERGDEDHGSDLQEIARNVQPPAQPRRQRGRFEFPAAWRIAGFPMTRRIAAMILLPLCAVIGVFYFMRERPAVAPSPVARLPEIALLDALVNAVWSQAATAPQLGSGLAAGQSLDLAAGFVQLRYPSGVKVILQGPARATVDASDRIALYQGRLTASIPPAAHGFAVGTPSGDVVDLGTEFGVNIRDAGAAQVEVFRGHVELAPHDAGSLRETIGAGDYAELHAGGADRKDSDSRPVYIRDIAQIQQPIAVFGTGTGLKPGDADSHWDFFDTASQTPPKPAVVLKMGATRPGQQIHVQGSAAGQWISRGAGSIYPAGLFTFGTSFNLAGLDPATARLTIRCAADDYVAAIRLNGKPIGADISSWPHFKGYMEWREVTIDNGFVPGVNRLELDVDNLTLSGMGLCAQLSGIATAEVRQAPATAAPRNQDK